jgi:hypothetical protein
MTVRSSQPIAEETKALRKVMNAITGSIMTRMCCVLGLLLANTGCKNLNKFDTSKNEVFCGELVSAEYASEGFEYWTRQSQPLQISMTLDTNHLDDLPGKLRSNDTNWGPCAPLPLFDDAPLRTIKKALGDRLSNIRLGEDHDEEILAFVDSTCSGSMLAIVSLVQDGNTELRLIRPAKEATTEVTDQPRFGVFSLTKRNLTHATECDF